MRKHKQIILPLVLFLIVVTALFTWQYIRQHPPTYVLTGVVTEKFTDCVGGQKLDDKGNTVPISESFGISCDGGSYISVDRNYRFTTSTGNVLPQDAYDVDVSKVKVGDTVTVRYINDSGYKSLNCNTCSVEVQN